MTSLANEIALTESRTLRAQAVERTDVLSKVGALALLPDSIHATTELVANYYEVDIETIRSLVKANRAEFAEHGYRVLRGAELREFERSAGDLSNVIDSKARALALFTRKAMVNVGLILTKSEVAKDLRRYLLGMEEAASVEMRMEAVERAELAVVQMKVLAAADGIVDRAWLELKARHVAAKVLGEEPEVDPLDKPLYVPDFLKSKGLKGSRIISVQSWFGRRAASLYEAETGEKPGKRTEDTVRGSVRETYAWTERHRPVFEETWTRFYAADYPEQGDIFGGES